MMDEESRTEGTSPSEKAQAAFRRESNRQESVVRSPSAGGSQGR